jgi:hypothetical protein
MPTPSLANGRTGLVIARRSSRDRLAGQGIGPESSAAGHDVAARRQQVGVIVPAQAPSVTTPQRTRLVDDAESADALGVMTISASGIACRATTAVASRRA